MQQSWYAVLSGYSCSFYSAPHRWCLRFRLELCLLLCLLFTACMPIPTIRLDLDLDPPAFALDPARVSSSYYQLEGYPAENSPEAYNRAPYLRYFIPEGRARQARDTIIVVVPGLFAGASDVDILARQVVAAIPGVEVWSTERRANLLEDRLGSQQALATGDPWAAYAYYIRDAGTPEGFQALEPEDLDFMRTWGLELHLRDLHSVVVEARQQADTVILAGYSLGGSIAGFYAAFAIDEQHSGQDFIDGLLLIDGVLGRSGAFDRPGELRVGPVNLAPSIQELEAGAGRPFFSIGPFSPNAMARAEARALLAHLRPDALAPAGSRHFPLSNRALLGLRHSDRYGLSTVFSSSLGEPTNARFAGNLPAFIASGRQGAFSRSVAGLAEGAEYVGWRDDPASGARVSIAEFAALWAHPDANRNEWYFPVRLALDIVQYDVRLENSPLFIPNAAVMVPTLAVGAERGLVQNLRDFSAYSNVRSGSFFSSYIIPNYTHGDIVHARDNVLVALLVRWLPLIRRLPR